MDRSDFIEAIQIIYDKISLYSPEWELVTRGKELLVVYPYSDTLIELYNVQNDKQLRKELISNLCNVVSDSNRSFNASKISLYVLIRLGFIREAFDSIKKRKESKYFFFSLVDALLKESYVLFDNQQLKELLDIIDHIPPSSSERNSIIQTIINERYNRLTKKLKGINVEINQDRKTVSEKISYLDFDEKYNDYLNEIDKYLNTESSAVLNAGMINTLRIFMNDLIIDLAGRIAKKNSEEIPITTKTPIGNARNYIKRELQLSDNDNHLIDAFINILHEEGGHSFTSNKEYFRLARNIAIEISLLLLSKYEKAGYK